MKTTKYYRLANYNRSRYRNLLLCLILLLIAITSEGCDDFTDTKMPASELPSDAVFQERNSAYAAMANVFSDMRENGLLTGKINSLHSEMGLYTDELDWYGNSAQSSAKFHTNTVIPTNGTIGNWWNHSYNQIYSCNAIIEGVAETSALLQEDKDQLIGEARFARAFIHFYLLQLWGDIPYVTSTDYMLNRNAGKLPAAEVYGKIIEDLELAGQLLSPEYNPPSRIRPNSYTAQAFLARVQLYSGKWQEAEDSATSVINNTGLYGMTADLNDVFLKGSTTTIWQYAPRSSSRNSEEGTTFIFNSAPPNALALTQSLMEAFETGDQRREKWTRPRIGGSETYYHAYKYKKTGTQSPQTEFSVVIRLAEMYLIRAEASARQGNNTDARNDINIIRNMAGLKNTEANTQTEILQAILHERRVEFFTEWGHRFMDLKRFALLDAVLSVEKPAWEPTDKLLPLPNSELNLNPNLKPQNPGY
jgi:hypothetical protein